MDPDLNKYDFIIASHHPRWNDENTDLSRCRRTYYTPEHIEMRAVTAR
jgi:hypothetical protein